MPPKKQDNKPKKVAVDKVRWPAAPLVEVCASWSCRDMTLTRSSLTLALPLDDLALAVLTAVLCALALPLSPPPPVHVSPHTTRSLRLHLLPAFLAPAQRLAMPPDLWHEEQGQVGQGPAAGQDHPAAGGAEGQEQGVARKGKGEAAHQRKEKGRGRQARARRPAVRRHRDRAAKGALWCRCALLSWPSSATLQLMCSRLQTPRQSCVPSTRPESVQRGPSITSPRPSSLPR